MLSKSSRFILVSVLIHAFLVFLLWKSPSTSRPHKKEIHVEITQKPIEISGIRTGKSHGKNRSTSNQNTSLGETAKFFPKYTFEPEMMTNSNGDTYLAHPETDNPNAEWGSGSASFGRIKDYSFFNKLYEQIDGSLSYPSVLARNKIKGVINSRIVFNADGNCDWRRTKIHGQEAYLSLYILDVLKNVCKMNFKKFLHERTITNADLSFHFDITEGVKKDRLDEGKMIVGNTLLFYRNSQQSIAEWEVGPLKGMFPVPMIYLNIPWIQENWERLINNKDPLREFKRKFGEEQI